MLFLAYIFSLFIGLSLGLIGGGGSILAVPVLVYLAGVDPVLATAYSLFIVGMTSLFGAVQKYRQGLVNLKVAMTFGLPSVISVYLTRKFLMPAIPEIIWEMDSFILTKSGGIMILFSVMMIVASYSMIKKSSFTNKIEAGAFIIIMEGIVVGVLTGLVGAGGGFLIIPALVVFLGLDMKIAVGTSLVIIAFKSIFGFIGDLSIGREIDWSLLLWFTLIAVIGIFVGNFLSKKIKAEKLKTYFGYFVLVVGIYILAKQFI